MLVVESFELFPFSVALDALLFVDEFDCFCDWFWLPPVTVLVRVFLFVFEELPEFDTPEFEDEFPPVALAPELEVEPLVAVAPEVEDEVLFDVDGVGVGVDGTQMNAMPSTTS